MNLNEMKKDDMKKDEEKNMEEFYVNDKSATRKI